MAKQIVTTYETQEIFAPSSDFYAVTIDLKASERGVHITRFVDGQRDEAYRPYSLAEGAIAVAALFSGFQPPPVLCPIDKPTRRTRPARSSRTATSTGKKSAR